MEQIVIVIHVIVAVILIGLVLVQHGKGADAGASFGSGSSNTMFGSQGAMPFLMKITALLAAIFFATNLTMSYLVGHRMKSLESGNTQAITKPASMTVPSANEKQKKKKQEFVFPSVNNTSPQGSGQKK
jgi:preprotein translocase subunit SecG